MPSEVNHYKISVLVTFYNQEKYVDDALNSVFSQIIGVPFKVIIGDDGSDDGTLDKVREWEKKYPAQLSYIVQKRDSSRNYIGGSRASQNRLALLRLVDTPYFIYLDGDDYWTDPNKLQLEYDILENPQNRGCVACAHQIKAYNESEPEKSELIPKELPETKLTLEEYWEKYYFHTDTILFRSDPISRLRYDLLKDSFNDNLITYSFLQFGNIYYLPRCMADYRQNSHGIWAAEDRAVGMIRDFMAYDIEKNINPDLRKIIDARHLYNFFYLHDHKDQFKNINEQYYIIAKQYGLKTAEGILTKNPFSLKKIKVKAKVFTIMEQRKWEPRREKARRYCKKMVRSKRQQ